MPHLNNPDHLPRQWRTVLCARDPYHRVFVSDYSGPHRVPIGLLPVVLDMVNEGWLEPLESFRPLRVYQITKATLDRTLLNRMRRRSNPHERVDNWNQITLEDALAVRELLMKDLRLPDHQTPSLVGRFDDLTLGFTLVLEHRLSTAQLTEMLDMIQSIVMTNRWYSGSVLRPATQEYHLTFWTHE